VEVSSLAPYTARLPVQKSDLNLVLTILYLCLGSFPRTLRLRREHLARPSGSLRSPDRELIEGYPVERVVCSAFTLTVDTILIVDGDTVEGSFRFQSITKDERPVLWIANAKGISEIIVDAIEHHNLGITYEEKTRPERGTCNG
jgi:hypothetical protein